MSQCPVPVVDAMRRWLLAGSDVSALYKNQQQNGTAPLINAFQSMTQRNKLPFVHKLEL